MRVLHSAWLSDAERLVVWAEDGSEPRTAAPRRGRPTRQRRPVPHPFALGHDGVRLAAAEVGGTEADDLIGWADEIELLLLLLPAGAAGPVASPLLEDGPARPDGPGLLPLPGSGEPPPATETFRYNGCRSCTQGNRMSVASRAYGVSGPWRGEAGKKGTRR